MICAITSPEESIAILVRGRGHLRSIIPALREAKLYWQAIDITPLASRMPVIDLLSLTRALLSPADKIAWLAVLRAPFCGLSLGDLLAVANSVENHSENRYQQSNAILAPLISCLKTRLIIPLVKRLAFLLLDMASKLCSA